MFDTHVAGNIAKGTGAIIGVGTVRKLSAVRWGVAGRVLWAWLFTVPGAAAISAATFWLLQAFGFAI